MTYAFFGSPQFASWVLEKLVGGGLVPATVVTNPDRPVGRMRVITPPPVKQYVMGLNPEIKNRITILQIKTATPETLKQLGTGYDFFLVVAYANILPKSVLTIPRLGTIGIHPSLLPRYRGPTPIQSALLTGEKKTGVTLYLLDERADHGPILMTSEVNIENDDSYTSLLKKLAESSAKLLLSAIPSFALGKLVPQTQDEGQATATRKFTADDAFIDDREVRAALQGSTGKAERVLRKIKALNPEPGTWTTVKGKRLKLLEACVEDNKLKLLKIQWEGQKPTSNTEGYNSLSISQNSLPT